MRSKIPVMNMEDDNWKEQLNFNLMSTQSCGDYRNDRGRPYNGQPHTTHGIRGETLVEGLTMRDIHDCLIKAFLNATGRSALYDKVEDGTWRERDVYDIPEDFDPIAVAQSMGCEIEKMMDIYPNTSECPSLEEVKQEIFGEMTDG